MGIYLFGKEALRKVNPFCLPLKPPTLRNFNKKEYQNLASNRKTSIEKVFRERCDNIETEEEQREGQFLGGEEEVYKEVVNDR